MPARIRRWFVLCAVIAGFAAAAAAQTQPQITSATAENATAGSPFYYQIALANQQFIGLNPTNTYLINSATNLPQFCAGEDGWDLIEQLSNAEVETYLADRASRGYNCIWVALADNTYQSNPPQDYYGNVPFDGADFTNEDATYWSHVDYVLGRMAAYGITAFASPAFVGETSQDGYYNSYQSSSDATMVAYGTWLANRYLSAPNLVWVLGGDTLPAFYSKVADIATGIRAVDSVHLVTMEGTPQGASSETQSSSADAYCTPNCPSWLNVNWIYNQYESIQFGCAYNTATYSLPNLLGESWYEGDPSLSELNVREEGYWGILSGCPLGNLFGNDAIWTMGGPFDSMGVTWQSQLSSVGSVGQEWEGALFRSREFWMLQPDPNNTYLTGGYGSGTSISVLSRTSDGQTMIVYIPNGDATTVTINMAGITSSTNTVQGWWFNPQTGATTNLGTFSNSGSESFTPPDANDWVLVLDDNSAALPAPATTVMTPGPSSVTFGATGLPSGLSINTATGMISGTPTGSGTFSVGLTATNSAGTGTATLTLTLSQSGSGSKSAPTITWPTPASITYGTVVSSTQLDATASVPGTFSYYPAAGWAPAVGTHTLKVTFTPTDTTDYKTVTASVTLTVNPASLTVTADNASRLYGAANPAFGVTFTGFVYGDSASVVSGSAALSTTATTSSPAGAYPITVAQGTLSAANYVFTTFNNGTLTVNPATPTITWATPASIVYGTGIGSTQLNATASVAGTFSYNPPAGWVGIVGTHNVTATFTPSDYTDYKTATATVTLTVTPASLTVTANNASRPFGAANPAFSASFTGFVHGDSASVVSGSAALSTTATSSSPVGAYPISVAQGTLTAANYVFTTFNNGNLTVNPASPTITWATPASITYGAAIGSTQQDATASVPGTFSYNPPAGWVGVVGTHNVTATFTPTDSTDYKTATATVTLTVTPASLTVTASDASRPYGAANPTLSASFSGFVHGDSASVVSGTASLSTTAITSSPAGAYPITVAQGTLSAANYVFTTFDSGTLTVSQASPTITWATPTSIAYGTGIGSTQLDATASVPGTFSYNPPAGWVGIVGTHNVTATFTPTDSTDYKTATGTVTLTVTPASLTVTASDASRPYGAANPTFNASFTGFVHGDSASVVSGSAALSTTATTSSPAGAYPITVALGTLSAANYVFTTFDSGTLTVSPALPTITWATPASIVYGTAIGSTQQDATASVPGTFSYNPPAGWVGVVGTHNVTATFTPTDSTDYKTATASVTLTITPASLTVTANNASRPYGAANPTFNASFTGFVHGDSASVVSGLAALSTTATTSSPAGAYPITVAQGTLSAANYVFTTFDSGTLTVSQASPTITWATPASITYGTAIGSTQQDATASVPGTFSYNPPAGWVGVVGTHNVTATFTPTDSTDYKTATASVTLTVTPASLTVTANNASRPYGAANPTLSASFSGFVHGDSASVVSGSAALSTTATTSSPAGAYPISVAQGTLSAANYVFTTFDNGTLTINPAMPTITWATPASITYGTAIGPTQLDATASVPGTFSYYPATGWAPAVGTHPVTATFTPTDSTDYKTATASVTLTVTPASLTVTANNASRPYGAANPTLSASFSGFVHGDSASVVSGSAALSTTATTSSPAGAYPISVARGTLSAANYVFTTFDSGTLTVSPALPTITWATPASITYGTAIGSIQQDATASVPGTFSYYPAAGWVPAVGTHTLKVTFTPTDNTDYKTATATVNLTVNPAR